MPYRGEARQPRRELVGDPLRGAPVPELGPAPALAAGTQDLVDACERARAIATDERVRALLDRDRTLGVLAHREAGHGERRRLLLDAAGVGQHERRSREESQHLEVALRRQERDARVGEERREPEPVDVGARARMHGPDERQPPRDVAQDATATRAAPRGRRRWTADAA